MDLGFSDIPGCLASYPYFPFYPGSTDNTDGRIRESYGTELSDCLLLHRCSLTKLFKRQSYKWIKKKAPIRLKT
jgi:hypothetical protein